ncbi:MAG: acyl-CoA dehydrogenase family protein [Myxococcota bacterium]
MGPDKGFSRTAFRGTVREDLLLPYPEVAGRERAQLADVLQQLEAFAADGIDPAEIDREGRLPERVIDGARHLGLFGMTIPTAYGGAGLSATASARVLEGLAAIDASLAVTVGAHQSLGVSGVLRHGTDAQRDRYLPRLAGGRPIAGFAMTEPHAGSDASAVTTRAELTLDGEGYLVNGHKIWVTNGGLADLFTVVARTSPPEGGAKPGLTTLLVERDTGVRTGPEQDKVGIRGASTTSLYMEDARIPASNVLGHAGRGLHVAVGILNEGRLALAAGCLGSSKRILRLAADRCLQRRAFGRRIGDFEMVRKKLAHMACATYALESMTYLTTGLIDAGLPDHALESAACKIYGSETHFRLAHAALQIAGGSGYMCESPFQRLLRDARINSIFNGTNEVLRVFVALAGLQEVETWSASEGPFSTPVKQVEALRARAVQRVLAAVGRGRPPGVHSLLKGEWALLEENVARLASAAEHASRRYGRRVADRQLVLERLADASIDIYGLAAVIARTTRAVEARGEEGARRELDLARGHASLVRRRLRAALGDVDSAEDELLSQIAGQTLDDAGYPLDVAR